MRLRTLSESASGALVARGTTAFAHVVMIAQRSLRLALLSAGLAGLGLPLRAQESRSSVPSPYPEIAPGVYLVSDLTGNLLVLLGKDGPVVVGEPAPGLLEKARAFLSSRGAWGVRYAVITPGDSVMQRRDGGWGRDGAITMMHENARVAMRFARSDSGVRGEIPSIGFSEVLQFAANGDEIHVVHQPSAYSDSDLSVHFEKRQFVYLGHLFTTDGYPVIGRGGSIAGLIAAAKKFLDMFGTEPKYIEPIVPGRGPLGTVRDLREYHDMLVAVRDRIDPLVRAGKSLEDVTATRPTAEFDARWGRGPVGADRFVAAVYQSLSKAHKAQPAHKH